MKTPLVSLVVLMGLCLVAVPRPSLAASEACAPDVKKFCAAIEKGGGRIVKCLKDHQADLSDACKAQLTAVQAHQGEHKACAADAQKLCGEVQPGEGRIAKCLKQHEADLSAACKQERAANRQKNAATPPLAPKAPAATKP